MKTYSPKQGDISKKWYLVDLKDKIVGRAATKIANLLRGKDKPDFTPNIDCGDYVVAINAKYVKLTGNKLEDKMYYRHSRYPGGFKQKPAGEILEETPEKIIIAAVSGMLPKNRLRKDSLLKLKVFPGEEHNHEAQKPEKVEI